MTIFDNDNDIIYAIPIEILTLNNAKFTDLDP